MGKEGSQVSISMCSLLFVPGCGCNVTSCFKHSFPYQDKLEPETMTQNIFQSFFFSTERTFRKNCFLVVFFFFIGDFIYEHLKCYSFLVFPSGSPSSNPPFPASLKQLSSVCFITLTGKETKCFLFQLLNKIHIYIYMYMIFQCQYALWNV